MPHTVGFAFDAKNVVVFVDQDAVGVHEDICRQRIDEVALFIQSHQGMIAAVVDINAVLGVDSNGGDPPQLHAIWKRAPTLCDFVA